MMLMHVDVGFCRSSLIETCVKPLSFLGYSKYNNDVMKNVMEMIVLIAYIKY